MSDPPIIPCQYRTGRILGSGTYSVVKEGIHLVTAQHYACKVINKQHLSGREHMIRSEISVLKKVSTGHRNIVTLHDYFETMDNVYLVFDLCTGGELFHRIMSRGFYYEPDAAQLIRTIMGAVKYIHDCGIVHRDLKTENLLFLTSDEDADIMIADFGLSKVVDDQDHALLTELCGTPGYMAPEMIKRSGHGKPVDVWAMGVITYFLLSGCLPFDAEPGHHASEIEAIVKGDWSFQPTHHWANISPAANDFIRRCLSLDPAMRPTAEEALTHPWLADPSAHFIPDPQLPDTPTDLLPDIKITYSAKHLWRKATIPIHALSRMAILSDHTGALSQHHQDIAEKVRRCKTESELVSNSLLYYTP
ncbi:Pkinase-domain-containing protein [Fistulina hepatica ATCC 64428]|uniref:Pkinase-domain-containing protein n=1 Tax=Fistulina hepatica ATCC 64428 TaxID=1128425 RepID=A0A0D7AGR1_9AGAR|nr:Pkinase-domain-containing protein [Fistulina hepatica ATCC 64428]